MIGDEILNAKIIDTNSRFFAKLCYQYGVTLEKISVVGDKQTDIVDAVHEFDPKYDLTITSGGIGSTHDDITYESIAKAYKLPLQLSIETVERAKMMRAQQGLKPVVPNTVEWESLQRMTTLPSGDIVTSYYSPTSWTPVVTVNGKLAVLPGVPRFFEELLVKGLWPNVTTPNDPYTSRYVVTKVPELDFGKFLAELQGTVDPNIKLGSYPHLEQHVVTISITGRESEAQTLDKIAARVAKGVNGIPITKEQEEELTNRQTEATFLKGQLNE